MIQWICGLVHFAFCGAVGLAPQTATETPSASESPTPPPALEQVVQAPPLIAIPATQPSKLAIPRAALKYQSDLIRNVRLYWGLEGPIATLAGQIQQESAWNPNAHSAYASGLTQFTPDTASDLSKKNQDLGPPDPTNPAWALRAQSYYMKMLHTTNKEAKEPCSQMAFALSGYNGGQGWVNKDRSVAKKQGLDDRTYFGSVEMVNAGRAPDFFKENRDYPNKILRINQYTYASWGPTTKCE